jgi:NADPH:quinone reductase-like Zn-dependent oxidoreductase
MKQSDCAKSDRRSRPVLTNSYSMTNQTSNAVYTFDRYGGPEVLKLVHIPIAEPGFGEVRVRVQAMSLNRADLLWLANTYVETPKLPARLGYEVTGTVDAVGQGVSGFAVGDRVTSICAFSISDYGNFAETAILPARALIRPPQRFSPAEAASFSFAYFTGVLALYQLAQVKPGHCVLVTAGASTTGFAAINLLRKAGATVIATTRSRRKEPTLLKAGAHHVIVTREEDLVEAVERITLGRGVDIAYDCVAGPMSEQIARSLRPRGHWIVYGLLDTPGAFPWWTVFGRSLKFDAFVVFAWTGNRNLQLPGNEEAF